MSPDSRADADPDLHPDRDARRDAAQLVVGARETEDVVERDTIFREAIRAYERAGLDPAWFDDSMAVRNAMTPDGLYLRDLDRAHRSRSSRSARTIPRRGFGVAQVRSSTFHAKGEPANTVI
jgi:hypothetical protein